MITIIVSVLTILPLAIWIAVMVIKSIANGTAYYAGGEVHKGKSLFLYSLTLVVQIGLVCALSIIMAKILLR